MFGIGSARAWRGSSKPAWIVSPIRGKGSARRIRKSERNLISRTCKRPTRIFYGYRSQTRFTMRTILRDLRKPDIGEKVRARFNVPTKQPLWYYHSLAAIFCERLSNPLSSELREIVEVLEAEVANAGRRANVST
jgi:hypothetical protein